MNKKSAFLLCLFLFGLQDKLIAGDGVKADVDLLDGSPKITVHTDDTYISLLIFGSFVAAIIGNELYQRESNHSVRNKINKLASALYAFDATHGSYSFEELTTYAHTRFSRFDRKIMTDLLSKIHGRYTSFVTPWNWNKQMKQAYNRMLKTSLVSLYTPLLTKDQVSGDDLLQFAREYCSGISLYPYIEFHKILSMHIEFVKETGFFYDKMLDTLKSWKWLLESQHELVFERQTLMMHKLQEKAAQHHCRH